MSAPRLRRSLVFAALASVAWPAWAVATGPLLGAGAALSLYLVAAAAAHVASLAPRPSRGALAAAVTGALACAFLTVAHDPQDVALGAAIAIGVGRAGVLRRGRPARAVAVEVALLGGGLLLARCVAGSGLLGAALAIWGFFLVQSVWPTVGGARGHRVARGAHDDPFDQALRRALACLEREG